MLVWGPEGNSQPGLETGAHRRASPQNDRRAPVEGEGGPAAEERGDICQEHQMGGMGQTRRHRPKAESHNRKAARQMEVGERWWMGGRVRGEFPLLLEGENFPAHSKCLITC